MSTSRSMNFSCVRLPGDRRDCGQPDLKAPVRWAPAFPFVVPESDYAGQLKGFAVTNCWAYAFVDFLPYVLSLFGVMILEFARRGRSAWLFAMGLVLTFATVFGVAGDYYEAVSLVITQVGERLEPSWPGGVLISDDALALIHDLSSEGNLTTRHLSLIGVGLVAAYIVLMTLSIQVQLKNRWGGGSSSHSLS
jgi:hypothetical protein